MATAMKIRQTASKTLTPGLTEVQHRLAGIMTGELVQLNRESIWRNYSRNLKPGRISQLPNRMHIVGRAYRHVGLNGRPRLNVNYRLEVLLCEKRAGDPRPKATGLTRVLLDISPEAWKRLKQQAIAV